MSYKAGPHFLQIPGPSNIPGRVLRAIERPTMDHRGPSFQDLAVEVLEKIRPVFKTSQPVVIFPSSGTGAWEAALVNTLSPGDKVSFEPPGRGRQIGTLVKYNKKTVTIFTEDGHKWNVSPHLISKVKDVKSSKVKNNIGNVIEMQKE